MSIETQIIRLQNAKASIKTAIENKGVEVGDNVKLDNYAELIDSITVGSGDGEEHVNPDFYNVRTNNGTNYRYLFHSYSGTNLDLSNWDTSHVTNMSYMFGYCSSLTTLDLSNWKTSEVTDMSNMFNACSSLTSLDLSGFDTQDVTNMNDMFSSCSKLTSLDLSNFNTLSVKSMDSMFRGCTKLISLDLSGWDTLNVENMGSMFYGSGNMVLRHIYGTLDLSNLKKGFYPGSYANPVNGCTSLETLYLKNIYKNCTNITNSSIWSINLGNTVVKDECLLYIIDQLPDLINDKKLTSTNNIILTLPKTNALTEEQVKVAIDKGWQVANTTYHLPSYTVTYNLGENIICEEKQIVKEGIPFSLTLEVTDDYAINSVTVTMGNITVEPTYVTDNSGFITAAKINITSVTGDITITATAEEAIKQTTFTVGTGLDGNNILCITPETYNGIKKVTINGKTQTVPSGTNRTNYTVNNGDKIEIIGAFYLMNSTISSVSNFVLQSNITSMRHMFNNCKSLTSIDLSNCNTSKVIDMRMMFYGCESLTSLDLSNLDASNVKSICDYYYSDTNPCGMFQNCISLVNLSLPISFGNVNSIDCMFKNCRSLTSLDLSNLDTRNLSYNNGAPYGFYALSNVPVSIQIKINPEILINPGTGVKFTSQELSWISFNEDGTRTYGTFTEV